MSTPPPHGAGSEGGRVDDPERLTSYLDGTLDADERAALEAELAGSDALRSQLQELERADRELAQLEPTELPDGARDRLATALDAAFDELLSPDPSAQAEPATLAPTTAAASGGGRDELSRRRSAPRRSLVPATAGVAAGLVLLVGGVAGLSQLPLGGGGDDETAMLQTDQVEELAPDDDPALSGVADDLAADLPVVIDDGRSTTQQDAHELLDDPQLQALAQLGLSMEDGATLAEVVQRRVLGAAGTVTSTAPEGEETAEDTDQDRGSATEDQSVAPLVTRDGERLDAAVAEDLRRCLAELLDPGEQAVPVAVEVVALDGGDAVVFGLLTLDPDTGAFTRIEAWTLALDSCQVLRFDQS